MTTRPIWTYEETDALLAVIQEKNVMKRFGEKKYKNSEIYKLIEREMMLKGFIKKNADQIQYRWKNLKRSHFREKKNNITSGLFYEDLDRILSGVTITADGESYTMSSSAGVNEESIPSTSFKKKILRGHTARHLDMDMDIKPNTSLRNGPNKDFDRSQRRELLVKAVNHLEKYDKKGDETDTFSACWGILYRKLDPQQQLYANKTIMEVLYQGALGTLNEYSYKAVESPQVCSDVTIATEEEMVT